MTRRIARVLCTAAILFFGPLAVLSIAIVFFIVNGTLTPGKPMYVGSSTPTLIDALQQALIGLAVTAGLAYARYKLGSRAEA